MDQEHRAGVKYLSARLLRRKPKARSWDDATSQEVLEARVQQLEESVRHLADCATWAFEQCVPFRAESRPQDAFTEEWSK